VNHNLHRTLPVIDPSTEIKSGTNGFYGDDGVPSSQADSDRWQQLLWNERQLLRRWTVRGAIAVTLIAFLIPKSYESTTRLMPPDNQSTAPMAMMAAMAGKNSALGMLANDMLSLKSSDSMFMGILRSDTIQDRIIDRFDLRKVYWDKYMQDARKDLTRNTDISQDRKSGIITVEVTDRDPKRAAEIARAYIEELDTLVAQLSTSAARRERIFIEQRLQVVRQNLTSASQTFSEFASKNSTIDIKAQSQAIVEAAATLQGQMIAAQSELEGLEQIYTPNNVRVKSLQARIGELKRQIEKMNGDSTPPSLDGTKPDELSPPIRKLPLLGVRWMDLYRETKVQETVYELLTQQYEMAKIQEAKEIPTVKVLDVAGVPEKKASPPRLVIMIVGTMFCFSAACAWILGSARWRQIDSHDPNKQLAIEVGRKVHARTSVLRDRIPVFRSKNFSSDEQGLD
jgi:capsule polysaccharide export protein KpsE/RkpR